MCIHVTWIKNLSIAYYSIRFTYHLHLETEAENRERRIRRDEERIRNGLVVANSYLQESAKRLADDLARRVSFVLYLC